ncbi:MAG TPA: hypothetical protein VFC07_04440 [Verrucomicrobiae bacterium]|nr:hypothetical protein [Verrucomicrobiae bacterium]
MKLAKWLIVAAVVGVAVGGVLVVRTKAAEARQLNAVLGVDDGAARPALDQRIAKRLGLTAEQKKQIKAVLAADSEKLTTDLKAIHDARVNLRATIRKTGTTENEIRGASAKVAAAEADLAVERAALYGKIAPILTADQMAQVNQLQERVDDAVDGAIGGLGRRLTE